MAKKILEVVPYNYLPWFSGGQKSIAQFAEYLGAINDLTVVTVPNNDFSLAKNYACSTALKEARSRYADFGLIKRIKNLIKEKDADAIVWDHPYYAWLAWIIKKQTGIQTILRSHNIEYTRFKGTGKWWWPLLKIYEGWFFKFATKCSFVAQEDLEFAVNTWKLDASKCFVAPFGVPEKEHPADKQKAKNKIAATHQIQPTEKIILFNGLLDYKPNLDALLIILDTINPVLLTSGIKYKIIICGKRLPTYLDNLNAYKDKNIIFAGFVDDIESYFKGADIFLNPVQSGGGVKTKMIEAIAYGTTVIASKTGAAGITQQIAGSKLVVVNDNDWENFTKAILEKLQDDNDYTPESFYNEFYWGNIVKQFVGRL